MDKSYKNYLDLNEGKVSKFKYLYMMKESEPLHEDFMMIFASLFNPRIFVRGGGYFLEETFVQSRYDKMVGDGVDLQEVSYWLNMVDLTGLFGDAGYEYAAEIGAVIQDCWNAKLNNQFPDSGFAAQLLLWEDLDEVWVTVCKI